MGRTFAARSRIAALLAIAGMVVVATAAPAAAAPKPPGGVIDNKTFTVDVDGANADFSAPAGDADAIITLKITNTSPSQQLGSADVTVPADFAIAGQVVKLRNLALPPGGGSASSVTVTFTVGVRSCVPTTPAQFGFAVKQSNDFKGTGNDFYPDPVLVSDPQVDVTGRCSLEFKDQPSDTKTNTAIRTVTDTAVTVRVVDALGTQTATSSTAKIVLTADNPSSNVTKPISVGNNEAFAVAGVASFEPGPTITQSASGYTLTAWSPAPRTSIPVPPPSGSDLNQSGPSASFAIADNVAVCKSGNPCPPVSAGNAVAKFTDGTSADTKLLVTVNAADKPSFQCVDYEKPNAPVAQFAFSGNLGGTRSGTFELTIPNAINPVNAYQVCWASPVDFITKSGLFASAEFDPGDGGPKPGFPGVTLNVGLLPDCPKFGEPTTQQKPCISARNFNRQQQALTIIVKTTGADPWAY